jgi:hypothetical protein
VKIRKPGQNVDVRAAVIIAAIGSAVWSVLPAQAATARPVTAACCTVRVNGPAATMTVTNRGATAQATFRAAAGQRVSEVVTNVVTSDDGCETLTLLSPDGAIVGSGSNCGNGNNAGVGPSLLTTAGIYTVRLTVDRAATAVARLWVSAPVSVGTVTVNGPAKAMDVTRVGQAVVRTFSGTAGERIKAVVSSIVTSDNGCAKLTLKDPAGVSVGSGTTCRKVRPILLASAHLGKTGTFTAMFQVDTAATGTGELKISS